MSLRHYSKDCRVEVCLKHRFPKDHQCGSLTKDGRVPAPADAMKRLSVQAAQARAAASVRRCNLTLD